MSEPYEGLEPLEYSSPDQIFEFDVEMIPDPEGIDAVVAWAKANSKSINPKSAADSEADDKKRDDPDRPAA